MKEYRGTVMGGMRKATALGFPTINIALTDTELSGIFAGIVMFDDTQHNAALYADQERKILEAHLLDFDGELHGTEVLITPLKKIREKEIFDDFEKLKEAIQHDIRAIKIFFKES